MAALHQLITEPSRRLISPPNIDNTLTNFKENVNHKLTTGKQEIVVNIKAIRAYWKENNLAITV